MHSVKGGIVMGKEKRKRVHSGKKHNMEEFYRKLDVKNNSSMHSEQ